MDTKDIESLVARAVNLGMVMMLQKLRPKDDIARRKDVIPWLRMQGFDESCLDGWEKAGFIKVRSKGERSVRRYSMAELTKVILMREMKIVLSNKDV